MTPNMLNTYIAEDILPCDKEYAKTTCEWQNSGKMDLFMEKACECAKSFGVDVFESLVKISEITELVEREKKLDALRWNWMEDAIFFDYFTVERIFAFLLKLEMIERWISLDKERGNQLFRSIIESLKNDVQIPAEFR